MLILAVERAARNRELLIQCLSREGYLTLAAATLEELDQVLDQAEGVALALVDLAGFDQSIWARCDRLREKGIPLLVLSPQRSTAIGQASFAHGAQGVLVKPCAAAELLGMVRRLLKEAPPSGEVSR